MIAVGVWTTVAEPFLDPLYGTTSIECTSLPFEVSRYNHYVILLLGKLETWVAVKKVWAWLLTLRYFAKGRTIPHGMHHFFVNMTFSRKRNSQTYFKFNPRKRACPAYRMVLKILGILGYIAVFARLSNQSLFWGYCRELTNAYNKKLDCF